MSAFLFITGTNDVSELITLVTILLRSQFHFTSGGNSNLSGEKPEAL